MRSGRGAYCITHRPSRAAATGVTQEPSATSTLPLGCVWPKACVYFLSRATQSAWPATLPLLSVRELFDAAVRLDLRAEVRDELRLELRDELLEDRADILLVTIMHQASSEPAPAA